eukprot:jgi/Hompol1/1513/HPOL_004756-RA
MVPSRVEPPAPGISQMHARPLATLPAKHLASSPLFNAIKDILYSHLAEEDSAVYAAETNLQDNVLDQISLAIERYIATPIYRLAGWSAKRLMPLIPEEPLLCPQGWMTRLMIPSFSLVSCVAWSPNGRLIVAGSSASSSIVVWDTLTETSEMLAQSGGATRQFVFSTDGSFLLQAYKSGGIRIWETITWTKAVEKLDLTIYGLAWLPDSRLFLFCLEGDSRVGMIQMAKHAPCLETITTPFVHLGKIADPNGDLPVKLGGIRQMVMSPLGERIAILFDKMPKVALFAIDTKPLPEFSFIGYIQAPYLRAEQESAQQSSDNSEIRADQISFARQYGRGALLSIAWSNGKLSFVPLLFKG